MALLEDKQALGREEYNFPIFGFPFLNLEVTLCVYASLAIGVNVG